MSNYYAKAINPRTDKLEKAVVLDMGKDNFIQFEDGWKYNTKFYEHPINPITEQEAINKCKSGGAYRADDGFLVETCKFCLRDMPYGEKDGSIQQLDNLRICMGACNNDCDYTVPYGFVPECGCNVHDRDEQEAINQDGEEMIYEANRAFTETFGNPVSSSEAFMYFIAGLFALIPLVYGIVICAKLIFKWIVSGV